jgi:outer membrane protein TolC
VTPRLAAPLLAAACAIGPHYHRPETALPAQFRPPSTGEDSLSATYDALAASRDSMAARRRAAGDSASAAATNGPTPPGFQLSDTGANLAWLDLFQDTVLTQLVVAAIQDNPDVRVAAATVQEYRAALGQATAGLFPTITITGQTGRQKQTFGNVSVPGTAGAFTVRARFSGT